MSKRSFHPGLCRIVLFAVAMSVSIMARTGAAEEKLLPWQQWLEVPAAVESHAEWVNNNWYSSGGKEGTLTPQLLICPAA
jgi:hypothetical protein